MASKEQERKALEQIKEIIDSVGGYDSYIGMAFAGCCSVAADNIENDFGNSYKASLEHVREELKEQREQKYRTAEKYAETKMTLKKIEQDADELNRLLEEANKKIEKEQENTYKAYEAFVKEKEERERIQVDSEIEIDRLNQEIIVLKAKLYDLISQ